MRALDAIWTWRLRGALGENYLQKMVLLGRPLSPTLAMFMSDLAVQWREIASGHGGDRAVERGRSRATSDKAGAEAGGGVVREGEGRGKSG